LASRTEGWPAGVQMAALALGRRPDPASLIASFSGSHRFVVDFLTSEVLRGQPPAVRRFLEETSLLDRLTADLCAAVTDRADSQRLLEEIERQNLFLEPLDDRRGWWRYHRLFADALRARLETTEPERANAIHRRASQWFRREGIADQAIAHALAATDFDAAAEVVEAYVDELFLRSERATLERWLSRFPPAVVHARPRLLLARARLALQRGDPSAATPWRDRGRIRWLHPVGRAGPQHHRQPPGGTGAEPCDRHRVLRRPPPDPRPPRHRRFAGPRRRGDTGRHRPGPHGRRRVAGGASRR